MPKYYEWRSRSGCYFCFYQRKIEWIGLSERHPELFEKAKDFELYHKNLGRTYTWSQDESLEEMVARKDEIKAQFALSQDKPKKLNNLMDVLSDDNEDDDGCLVCFK